MKGALLIAVFGLLAVSALGNAMAPEEEAEPQTDYDPEYNAHVERMRELLREYSDFLKQRRERKRFNSNSYGYGASYIPRNFASTARRTKCIGGRCRFVGGPIPISDYIYDHSGNRLTSTELERLSRVRRGAQDDDNGDEE